MKKLILIALVLLFGTPAFGQYTAIPNGTGAAAQGINGAWSRASGSGGGTSVPATFYPDLTKSSFDQQIATCLTDAEAAGGTCDARGVTQFSMNATVTVGDGTHPTTLLLPIGNINMASGVQFLYDSYATIKGAGSGNNQTVINDDGTSTVAAIAPTSDVTTTGIFNAHLEDFQVDRVTATSGSIGLLIGANASTGGIYGTAGGSVLYSTFSNIMVKGFDKATEVLAQAGGCTCYNQLNDVFSQGASFGLYVGSYVNSNLFTGGQQWGSRGVGLYMDGDLNTYLKPDIENSSVHGIEIAGKEATIIAPYEEANGADVLDSGAQNNTVFGSGYITFTDNSGSNTNLFFGSHTLPNYLGVHVALTFGNGAMYNDASNNLSANLAYDDPYHNAFSLNTMGSQIVSWGWYGYANLNLGAAFIHSGIKGTGEINTTALANPIMVSVTQGGTAGTTRYTYYVVCHDASGGVTLPSSGMSTSTGNATLSATNYNIITWYTNQGCKTWDILKGNTRTALAVGVQPDLASTTATTISYKDTGQATSAYTAPTHNSTADANFAGAVTEGCAGIARLSSGAATVTNDCIKGTRPVVCTDQTAIKAVKCTPSSGSLSIGGTGSDVVSWAQF